MSESDKTPPKAKDYRCLRCDVVFSRAYNLKSHMAVHRDEKPFECNYEGCQKRFGRHHDLTRHKKLHENAPRHMCIACGQNFSRQDALHRHFRNEAGKDCVAKLGSDVPVGPRANRKKHQSKRDHTPPFENALGHYDPTDDHQHQQESPPRHLAGVGDQDLDIEAHDYYAAIKSTYQNTSHLTDPDDFDLSAHVQNHQHHPESPRKRRKQTRRKKSSMENNDEINITYDHDHELDPDHDHDPHHDPEHELDLEHDDDHKDTIDKDIKPDPNRRPRKPRRARKKPTSADVPVPIFDLSNFGIPILPPSLTQEVANAVDEAVVSDPSADIATSSALPTTAGNDHGKISDKTVPDIPRSPEHNMDINVLDPALARL